MEYLTVKDLRVAFKRINKENPKPGAKKEELIHGIGSLSNLTVNELRHIHANAFGGNGPATKADLVAAVSRAPPAKRGRSASPSRSRSPAKKAGAKKPAVKKAGAKKAAPKKSAAKKSPSARAASGEKRRSGRPQSSGPTVASLERDIKELAHQLHPGQEKLRLGISGASKAHLTTYLGTLQRTRSIAAARETLPAPKKKELDIEKASKDQLAAHLRKRGISFPANARLNDLRDLARHGPGPENHRPAALSQLTVQQLKDIALVNGVHLTRHETVDGKRVSIPIQKKSDIIAALNRHGIH